jgi:Protein of unknown function (DUF3293)
MDSKFETKIPRDLIAAYLRTQYSFEGDAGQVVVRIGELCPVAAHLIKEFKSPGAFYITAYNPGSEPKSNEQNETASKLLRDVLPTQPGYVLAAKGEDPRGEWDAEPGFMVFGLARKDAEVLGERFGQNAIVWIDPSGLPELALLR